MSRVQRNKQVRKNWREARNCRNGDRDKPIRLDKPVNRREEFEDYLAEFGNIDKDVGLDNDTTDV